MPPSLEDANKVIKEIAAAGNFPKQITDIYYRDDYQDFQVNLENKFHCEIREKLISDYLDHKHEDIVREVRFRLDNAIEYEEWEVPTNNAGNSGGNDGDDGFALDDSANYDF